MKLPTKRKVMKHAAILIAILILLILVLSVRKEATETSRITFRYSSHYAVELAYLDNTQVDNDTWEVAITGPEDYGVLLIRNCGEEETFNFKCTTPEGWDVSFEKQKITLRNHSVGWCVLTFAVLSQTPSTALINITAVSAHNPAVSDTLTLLCRVVNTNGKVTKKGDQVVVSYTVWDENGSELDSGTLPATAGEPEAGPFGQVTYIDGFYLGLLGMERGGLGGFGPGETKQIKVPPELAYGVDSGHELSNETLIFELTLKAVIAP